MALKSSSTKTGLPEGAVLVTETEALQYQKNLVLNWPSGSEVIGLKYGSIIVGAVSALSSGLITNHFRRFFRADNKILAVTVIPAFAVPFYFAQSFTDTTVTKNILLMKVKCPLCLNMKFALQQFYCSFLFPSLYAFSAFAMYADLRGTYFMPSFQTEPVKFWKECFRAFKSGGKTFQVVGLLQTVMIFFLPYWQNQELCNITSKPEKANDTEVLLD